MALPDEPSAACTRFLPNTKIELLFSIVSGPSIFAF